MRSVLITGGAGFLGTRLAEALLRRGTLRGLDGSEQTVERLVLVDVVRSRLTDPRVTSVAGDIADPSLLSSLIDARTTSIFHLAAVVSGMAEADFEIGMRVNVDGSRRLLDACRARGHAPRLVFASSVAVYGGELPEIVTDSTPLRPQTSYGTQKALVELLIGDYTRRGFIDGRILRLPTVSVRPGRPNAAASSFASGIIREPVNGEEAICPVGASTRLWLLSPSAAIDCLLTGHEISSEALGTNRAVNLPGTSITAGEMVASLERVAGPDVARRVRWRPDARVERIVSSWPGAWDTTRARSLGFSGDGTFDAIVRRHIDETRHASGAGE